MSDIFEVRDFRSKQFFMVDDEYLNGYAKLCGSQASMVYLCLCRHADKHQESFPSRELIAEKLGISVATVKRAISVLKEWNLVEVEQKKSRDSKFLHNSYRLLDKKHWEPKFRGSSVTPDIRGSENEVSVGQIEPSRGSQLRPIKETHIEGNTYKDSETSLANIPKDISQGIKEFETVNKACVRFYGNTTQRQAMEDLIKHYGYDKVIAVIKILPRSNNLTFHKATTPKQLWDNWASIEAELVSLKTKGLSNNKYQVTKIH